MEKLSKWKRFKRWLRRGMTPTWFKHITYQISAFIISVAMIFGVTTYAFTKGYEESDLNLPEDFVISARADSFNVDDDSMAYVDAIVNYGVKVCEFDVHSRPNRTLVVSQDIVVTNNDGIELAKVFEALKEYDITINLNIRVAFDLEQLSTLINEYGMRDSVVVTGIEIFQVASAKTHLNGIPYYLNYMPSRTKIFTDKYQAKIIRTLEDSGAVGMNCPYANAGGKLSEVLHSNGYKLSVSGVDSPIKMKRILVCEPNNISTDDYYQLRELIDHWYD